MFDTFVTIPIQHALTFCYVLTQKMGYPSYGIAIILLTVAIKIILYPLTVKQVKSMKAIQDMQPKVKALQEKYKDKWETISPEAGKHKLLWMIGEIGEVIDIIKKNGDIRSIEDDNLRKHLIEEMADILMYYNDVLLCYGISDEELKEAYTTKFEKNLKRW